MYIVHLCFIFITLFWKIHSWEFFTYSHCDRNDMIHITVFILWMNIQRVPWLFCIHNYYYYYFWKLRFIAKVRFKIQRLPIHSHPYTCRIFPNYNILHQSSTLVTMSKYTGHIIITQWTQFMLWFSFSVTHSPGWDKYIYLFIMASYKVFTALRTLCVPPIHPSLPQPLASTDLLWSS